MTARRGAASERELGVTVGLVGSSRSTSRSTPNDASFLSTAQDRLKPRQFASATDQPTTEPTALLSLPRSFFNRSPSLSLSHSPSRALPATLSPPYPSYPSHPSVLLQPPRVPSFRFTVPTFCPSVVPSAHPLTRTKVGFLDYRQPLAFPSSALSSLLFSFLFPFSLFLFSGP